MKLPRAFAIAAALSLVNVASAQAQQAQPATQAASTLDDKSVLAIIGMKVETPSGARLGTVKDVVVDGYGHQTHAIISYAGMMGLGNKYTAVPWVVVGQMLRRDKLLMDQAQLENAPLLSSARPDSGNRGWRREADSYWRGKLAMASGS